jgi:hypothetical protein
MARIKLAEKAIAKMKAPNPIAGDQPGAGHGLTAWRIGWRHCLAGRRVRLNLAGTAARDGLGTVGCATAFDPEQPIAARCAHSCARSLYKPQVTSASPVALAAPAIAKVMATAAENVASLRSVLVTVFSSCHVARGGLDNPRRMMDRP